MNFKKLEWTITGIVIALIIVGIFNISYYVTFVLIGDKSFAFNIAWLSCGIIGFGLLIDIARTLYKSSYKEEEQEIDLADRRFKTVYPEELSTKLFKSVDEKEHFLKEDSTEMLINQADSFLATLRPLDKPFPNDSEYLSACKVYHALKERKLFEPQQNIFNGLKALIEKQDIYINSK